MVTDDVVKGSKKLGSFMTVRYDNKGIEMLELPKILHSKSVMNTIPQFLSNRKPPRATHTPRLLLVKYSKSSREIRL